MARPTAVAGLVACAAVLLLFGGQSVATILFPFRALFPVGYVPPIVRIFISDKVSLNVAVRNGEVVLARASYDHGDHTQIWWKIPPLTSLIDGEGDKYWLVNVATRQAMTSPTGDGQQVQPAEYNPYNGAQLWVPSPPRPQDAGFYQIKPYTDESALAALDAWRCTRRDGNWDQFFSTSKFQQPVDHSQCHPPLAVCHEGDSLNIKGPHSLCLLLNDQE